MNPAAGRYGMADRCVCGRTFGQHSHRPPHKGVVGEGRDCSAFQKPLTQGWRTGGAGPDPVIQAVSELHAERVRKMARGVAGGDPVFQGTDDLLDELHTPTVRELYDEGLLHQRGRR